MAAFSDYLEDKLVDHILRDAAFASPASQVWVSLHTASPLDDGTGAEVSGGGYARQQNTVWDAPANGATENTNDIDFGTATANWGDILSIGIWDGSTAGNLLFHGGLDASKTVNNGDGFKISASNLDVTIS